jgi:addiction module HigA family antidote
MLPKKRAPTHPGEMLQEEFLKPMGITQTAFAKHLGWSHAKVNEIITGKRGVTPEAALSFADALGTSAELWLNLQRNYDLWWAQQSHKKKPRLSNAG